MSVGSPELLSVKSLMNWICINGVLTLEHIAREINPILNGIINYYHKFRKSDMKLVWIQLNGKLLKLDKMEKGLGSTAAGKYLHTKYKENPTYLHTGHWYILMNSFIAGLSIKYLFLRDLITWRAVWRETFTHGSVRTRWWKSGRDSIAAIKKNENTNKWQLILTVGLLSCNQEKHRRH